MNKVSNPKAMNVLLHIDDKTVDEKMKRLVAAYEEFQLAASILSSAVGGCVKAVLTSQED